MSDVPGRFDTHTERLLSTDLVNKNPFGGRPVDFDDETCGQLDRIFGLIDERRALMEFPDMTDAERLIVLNQVAKTICWQRGQKRSDGSDYVQGHILPAIDYLVRFANRVGIVSVLAAIHHDDIEDTPATLAALFDINYYRELFSSRARGIIEIPKNIDEILVRIDREVRGVVDGLSKVPDAMLSDDRTTRADTRGVRDRATFVKLLMAALRHGARVPIIKAGGDRLQNMDTIRGFGDFDTGREKQARVAQETMDVYYPFADRVLHLRSVTAALVNLCVQVLNPDLLKEFQLLRKKRVTERLSLMDPLHRDNVSIDDNPLFEPHRYSYTDETDEQVPFEFAPRDPLHRSIVTSYVHLHSLADCFRDLKPPFHVADLRLADLDIGLGNPLCETVLLVKDRARLDHVLSVLGSRCVKDRPHVRTFDIDRGLPKDDLHAGVRMHIVAENPDARHGGRVDVRMNTTHDEELRRRGVITEQGSPFLPSATQDAMRVVIGEAKVQPRRVFFNADRYLFQPPIEVFTPQGRRVILPRGATPIDYAAALSRDLAVGLRSARRRLGIRDDRKGKELFLLDELPNGGVVDVDSCLSPKETANPANIKVDPGWRLFAKTQRGQQAVLSYLRNPYCPDAAIAKEEQVKRNGRAYLERLAQLFNMPIDIFYSMIKKRGGEALAHHDVINMKVGSGEIDPLFDLTREIEREERKRRRADETAPRLSPHRVFKIKAIVAGRPRSLRWFSDEFAYHNINIRHLVHKENVACGHDATGKQCTYDSLQCTLEPPADMPLYEFLKVLLKTNYRFTLQLENPLSGHDPWYRGDILELMGLRRRSS